MSVKHQPTVERYVRQHAELVAALSNLIEFVESMPAPGENGCVQNIDYGYTGSVGRIHELVSEANQIADEMTR